MGALSKDVYGQVNGGLDSLSVPISEQAAVEPELSFRANNDLVPPTSFEDLEDFVGPSPIHILWSFVKSQYPNMDSVTLLTTANGEPTTVVLLKSGIKPPDIASRLWSYSAGIILGRGKPPGAPCACPANPPIDHNTCCINAPQTRCIREFNFDYCSGVALPDACRNLVRAGAALSILSLTGLEIAKSSSLWTLADVKTKLPGGQLFFLWPYVSNGPELKDKYLLTKIDGDLLDRLLAVTQGSLRTFRKVGNRVPGVETLECDASGSSFKTYPLAPETLDNVFYLSLGRETSARVPPGEARGWSPSLYVETTPTYARIGLVPGVRPPIGGGNPEWLKFVDVYLSDRGRIFHCLPGVKLSDLHKLRAQINNPDAALFVFAPGYLRRVFEEYSQ